MRDFSPESTWFSYFGWNVVDSTSQAFPFINKIIYCPPGYGYSTSISSTTSFSGSTTIGNSYSVDGSAFVALELHIGAEAGFLGNGVTMNTLDISGKIGFKYNVNSDKSNTYNFLRTVNNTITTNHENVVITEDRTIKSFLIKRPTLQYLSDSSASTDTNKNSNCYFIANTPAAVSEMQPYSVSSFISKFKDNKDVMRNFSSLYAPNPELTAFYLPLL